MDTSERMTLTPRIRMRFLLVLVLLPGLAVPALGREQKALQKSLTDTQARAADAWLDQASSATNHGADPTLQVRSLKTGGTSRNQRTLVLFDLSSISRSGIKAATLALFMSAVPTGAGTPRTYNVSRVTSFWTEPDVTWNNRLPSSTLWTSSMGVCPPNCGGGDFGAVTASTSTPVAPGTMSWTITSDVQKYFGGAPPVGSYGAIISDSVEDAAALTFTGTFSSKENGTAANRPSLTVDFIQQVTGLTAAPGSGQVVLSWTYPAAVSGGSVLSATDGVVVLRNASTPVTGSTIITDGTLLTNSALNLCATVGTNVVVFKSGAGALPTLATGFTDGVGNPACAPANGTTYYYKVFVRDANNDYSANGSDSSFLSEITATPNATVSLRENAVWMAPTGSATLAPPGIIPLTGALITSNSSLVQGINLTNGSDLFAPASTGGAMSNRPPDLDAGISSLGRSVTYLVNQDNFVYAVDTSTGQIIWLANPTAGAIANNFISGVAVQVKSISPVSCTPATDLVIVQTNAIDNKNEIVAINGNTGANVWQVIGSDAFSQANPRMGVSTSTPFVDYAHCLIWATSANFGDATLAGPSLWKIKADTGALQGTSNVLTAGFGDVDASPTLTREAKVVFVGNEFGRLYAMSPTLVSGPAVPTITELGTPFLDSSADSAGLVKGSPLVLGTNSPFTIVYSRNVTVHAVSFDSGTNTFTTLWNRTMPGPCNVSSPIGFFGFSKLYVGCSDGRLYELNLADGTTSKTRNVNTAGVTVGEPSLSLNEIAGVIQANGTVIVGATDGRIYAFAFPF
jgi:hypothetical protein